MTELLESAASHWVWLALGLALAVAVMLAPGYFLIWLAVAAFVTGVIAWFVPLILVVQVTVFAVLALLAVIAGRIWLRANPIISADPLMNLRGERLVGENVLVTEALVGGNGRVRQGDSEWLARGPDAAAGTRMRVAGSDGAILIVEHVD
jgi:membrane protein implicated in regulation of membrane protease activity